MNKTILLAATSVLALTTVGAASAAIPTLGVWPAHPVSIKLPGKTLYGQNSNFGYAIISQNFSSTFSASYDAEAVDDFVVPQGSAWSIHGVDVTGVYFDGSGPATSEVITFYSDNDNKPGKPFGKPQTLHCTDSAGIFVCTLNRPVKLDNSAGKKRARYWVSLVANLAFTAGGEWGWLANTVTHNDPGKWRNPGNGYFTGCTKWTDTSTCIPTAGSDDFAFALTGDRIAERR